MFEGDRSVFTKTVDHDAAKLAEFPDVSSQLPYRRETILAALEENDIDLATIDAFVGRGGGLMPVEGGTYEVNETMLEHARAGANGVQHPAQLGSQLAHEFASAHGKRAFVVNPPDTDELCDEARMTGIKGVLPPRAPARAQPQGDGHPPCDLPGEALRGLQLHRVPYRRPASPSPRTAPAR